MTTENDIELLKKQVRLMETEIGTLRHEVDELKAASKRAADDKFFNDALSGGSIRRR